MEVRGVSDPDDPLRYSLSPCESKGVPSQELTMLNAER